MKRLATILLAILVGAVLGAYITLHTLTPIDAHTINAYGQAWLYD